jgi:hypothetical protein
MKRRARECRKQNESLKQSFGYPSLDLSGLEAQHSLDMQFTDFCNPNPTGDQAFYDFINSLSINYMKGDEDGQV